MNINNLIVLLGAGASYDSISKNHTSHFKENNLRGFDFDLSNNYYRPPIVKDIFTPLYVNKYLYANCKYKKANIIIAELQKLITNFKQVNFEEEITKIYQEINNSDATMQFKEMKLNAIIDLIYYFQELFVHCSRNYIKNTSNYHDLISRISKNVKDTLFITFNYDFLLENVIEESFSIKYEGFNDYIDSYLSIIKLHGSCNWAYNKPMEDLSFIGIKKEIESLSEKDLFIRNDIYSTDHKFKYFPAMVLPLNGKGDYFEKKFICPKSHIEKAKQNLSVANKLLIIGWSGHDDHLFDLLKLTPPNSKIQVVNPYTDSYIEEQLVKNFQASNIQYVSQGFGDYLQTNLLEDFIEG